MLIKNNKRFTPRKYRITYYVNKGGVYLHVTHFKTTI